jgi:hypothetical protein
MKKIFLLLFIMLFAVCAKAQQTVDRYQNTYFGKEFEIEATQENDKIQKVFIGIEAKDAMYAFISLDGKDLELFKTALELVKAKYLNWVKVAKDNNVTEIDKEFDIKFPSVTIAWSGSEWWFSFGQRVKMRFLILDSGKMIAVWAPKVTSSSNRYIDEQIYFAFEGAEDFDSLISQLNYQAILDQLLNKKNNEDLFQ